MPSTPDPYIYLLMTSQEVKAAQTEGTWSSESLETEGFIHASPYEQLERVANKYYREKVEVQIVHVRIDQLTSELRWEPAAGSTYPHLYGPLNFEAVARITPAQRNADGTFHIPIQATDC